MNKQIIIGIIFVILIFGIALFAKDKYYFDDIDLVKKEGEVTWAGHTFRIASSGNVEFVENGFDVSSTSNSDEGLATSKLLNINMNQKIKVTIVADMTGHYVSGDWSEFAIYLAENTDKFNHTFF
jgi:hypothetical protein